MKIMALGTGALSAKALSPSFLIDNEILIDCPNGIIKRMRNHEIDFQKIKIVIISHFHGDHDWDMPFLLREYNRGQKRTEPLTLIAPLGAMDRYKTLYTLALPEDNLDTIYENAKLNVIEISDKELRKPFIICDYKIYVYKMSHGGIAAYGFRIEKDTNSIAFTCDSIMCDNVLKVIQNAKIAFVDITNLEKSRIHMGIEDLEILKAKFPNCKVFPVHMTDNTLEELIKRGYEVPQDGDVFNIV